jgi:hypothetical protein
MKRAIILFRQTKLLDQPVVCGAFGFDAGGATDAQHRIEQWKTNFLCDFPEFRDPALNLEFHQTPVDLL